MFTFRWIQAIAFCMFAIICFPCFGQSSNAGYDRMDGDFIKPSKRAQPKRNFNLETRKRFDSTTSQRIGTPRTRNAGTVRNRDDDRNEGRTEQDLTSKERANTSENQDRTSTEEAPVSENGVMESEGYATTEAAEVAEDGTAPEERRIPINENQLVFCSKSLKEFHWDVDCRMLKNVKPTRLTYKLAKEARYTECTYCGWK